MLAAAPGNNQTLELVRLVLSLVEHENATISDELKVHTISVIQQAAELTANPADFHGNLMPEAVELAVEMKAAAGLADELANVTSFEKLQPELAKKMLQQMERYAAS